MRRDDDLAMGIRMVVAAAVSAAVVAGLVILVGGPMIARDAPTASSGTATLLMTAG